MSYLQHYGYLHVYHLHGDHLHHGHLQMRTQAEWEDPSSRNNNTTPTRCQNSTKTTH